MFRNLLVLPWLIFEISEVISTTEWFGDLRSELNPPRLAPFYDVVYDDPECPQGIYSNVIPNYVYFGEMIGTASVKSHTDCIAQCLSNRKCTATNYFLPSLFNSKAYCELLKENQYDNPKLMRPFHNAIYYEKIRCEGAEDSESLQLGEAESRIESSGSEDDKETTTRSKVDSSESQISKLKDPIRFMKKLATKVREFNLRFRMV